MDQLVVLFLGRCSPDEAGKKAEDSCFLDLNSHLKALENLADTGEKAER